MVLLTKRGACPCSRKCMLARSHTHTTTPVCTLTLTHTLGEIEVTNEGSDDQSHEQALADENLSKFIGQESRYVHRYSCMHLYLQKDISTSNVQLFLLLLRSCPADTSSLPNSSSFQSKK